MSLLTGGDGLENFECITRLKMLSIYVSLSLMEGFGDCHVLCFNNEIVVLVHVGFYFLSQPVKESSIYWRSHFSEFCALLFAQKRKNIDLNLLPALI